MDEELVIRKALKALDTKECRTITSTARKYGFSYTTLRDRYQGSSITRQHVYKPQIALNLTQEKAIIQWIGALTIKGFPPIYALLYARIKAIQYTENLEALPLSKNYLTKFIKRHLELSAAISNRRNKKRAIINPMVVYKDFFTKVAISK